MKKEIEPHIPELGEILKFLLDCFDVPRKGNELTYKRVERLSKRKGLSKEKAEQVARSILDTLQKELTRGTVVEGATGKLLEQLQKHPLKHAGFELDEKGNAIIGEFQLLKDLIEFIHRHQYLLAELKDFKNGVRSLHVWLNGFVIPYIASTLVDYSYTANSPETGMPGGRMWYVPQPEATGDDEKTLRLVMPVEQVLRCWEDLLGKGLENLADQLIAESSDTDNARRQIAAWKREGRVPAIATIERWSGVEWIYDGRFVDDPTSPLKERWDKCRFFLAGKGMIGASDWVKGAANSPFEPDRNLAKKYRGEKLEEEIPPFKEHAFQSFFDSVDPVGAGLPVENLLERVALRWKAPTKVQLHFRLLVARAMNKAWEACVETLGTENAIAMMEWFSRCYNHYMTLCEKSEVLSATESMRIHRQLVEESDPAFHPIAAMLDERYRRRFPYFFKQMISTSL